MGVFLVALPLPNHRRLLQGQTHTYMHAHILMEKYGFQQFWNHVVWMDKQANRPIERQTQEQTNKASYSLESAV